MIPSRYLLGLLFGVIAAGVLTPQCSGALFAFDSFGYADGSELLGQNGGSGFSGPWSAGGFNAGIQSNFGIASGSLNHAGAASSGNRVVTDSTPAISGLTRTLAAPLGASGSTVYLSFLLQPRNVLHEGAFNGFFGMLFERAGEPEVFFGKPGADSIGSYVLEDRGGSGQVPSSLAAAVGETTPFVVKAQFADLSDTFTLYLNPSDTEPVSGTVKSVVEAGSIDGLTVYSTGAFALDEVRLGDSFSDVVTPVPEPETCAAVTGVLLAAGVFFRKLTQRISKAQNI